MEPGKKVTTTTPTTSSVSGMIRDLTVSNLVQNWSGDGPVTVTAVSYTHLDVYKRQVNMAYDEVK